MQENQAELVYWIMRETGGIEPKADIRSADGHQHPASLGGHVHRAAGPDPAERRHRLSLARRVPRGVIGVISPFNFPLILSSRARRARARHRQRGGAQARSAHRAHRRLHHRPAVRGGRPAQGRAAGAAGRRRGRRGDLHRSRHRDGVVHRIEPRPAAASASLLAGISRKCSSSSAARTPLIVLDDAELDGVASACAFGAWFHQGQICMTTGLIIAHESIADALDRKARRQGQASAGRRSGQRARSRSGR